MKNIKLKLAVISALSLLSAQPQAAFQSLPASGGTTAYINCNTTGNFGSSPSTKPATSSGNKGQTTIVCLDRQIFSTFFNFFQLRHQGLSI